MRKRSYAYALVAMLLLGLCACGHVAAKQDAEVRLRFFYRDESVDVLLPENEAKQLCSIVNGKTLYADNPSCGFSEDISFEIEGKVFCPARDTCGIIKDCASGKFFNLSKEERDLLEKIFEAHGGFFPCV